jgi:phage tail-like protein
MKKKACLEYLFRVSWDNAVIPGVRRVSALKGTADIIQVREGGDPGHSHPVPGQWKFEPITLERGVTHDTAFETWANTVSGAVAAPGLIRKEVQIELLDRKGKLLLVYHLHRCWPSAYAAFEQLVDDGRSCLMEALTLQHEGWERQVPLNLVPAARRIRR